MINIYKSFGEPTKKKTYIFIDHFMIVIISINMYVNKFLRFLFKTKKKRSKVMAIRQMRNLSKVSRSIRFLRAFWY